jgi:hypothetical protein
MVMNLQIREIVAEEVFVNFDIFSMSRDYEVDCFYREIELAVPKARSRVISSHRFVFLL